MLRAVLLGHKGGPKRENGLILSRSPLNVQTEELGKYRVSCSQECPVFFVTRKEVTTKTSSNIDIHVLKGFIYIRYVLFNIESRPKVTQDSRREQNEMFTDADVSVGHDVQPEPRIDPTCSNSKGYQHNLSY
jgi:hypothetical protein